MKLIEDTNENKKIHPLEKVASIYENNNKSRYKIEGYYFYDDEDASENDLEDDCLQLWQWSFPWIILTIRLQPIYINNREDIDYFFCKLKNERGLRLCKSMIENFEKITKKEVHIKFTK